jgi:hypothetical protein
LSTQLNFTVATSPGLLTQEPGSTVKHVNFDIPLCTPAGQYNVRILDIINLTPRLMINLFVSVDAIRIFTH